jgi:site-specific DNA recombinase
MRACLYLRKSTEQKTTDERELSTERQKADCIAFCEKQGWKVVSVFTEQDGTSGTIDHDSRPELARLLADAKSKTRPWDVLVTWRDDRLSREGAGAITLLNTLTRKCGVRVFYAESGKEVSLTGTGLVLHSVEAYGSEAYATKIQTDTQAGRLRRFRTIEAWCSGKAPFGYRGQRVGDARDGHTILVIDPDQAATVRMIFQAIANGESVRGLRTRLNAAGIPAPTRGKATGDQWAVWSITGIARNETYVGTTTFNGERRHSESIRIIDQPLFDKVQRLLDQNVKKYASHRDERGRLKGRPEGGRLTPHALSDLLVCGSCGSKLWVVPGRGTQLYVKCKKFVGHGNCANHWGAPYKLVADELVRLIQTVDPSALRQLYLDEQARRTENASSIEIEITARKREVEALDKKIERLLDLAEEGEAVADRLKARQSERETAVALLADLEAKQAAMPAAFDWDRWMADAAELPHVLSLIMAHGAVQGTEGLHGRALLKTLLAEPVKVTPKIVDGQLGGWTIKARLNADPIFQGQIPVKATAGSRARS